MSAETVKVTKTITMTFTSKPKKHPPAIYEAKLDVTFGEDPFAGGWTMTFIRPSNYFHPCQIENLREAFDKFLELNDEAARKKADQEVIEEAKRRLAKAFDQPVRSVPDNLTPEVCQILFDAATEIDSIAKAKNGRTALYHSLAGVAGKHLPEKG